MDFSSKIDALDMVINILKEYGQDLDDKIGGLDGLIERLEDLTSWRGARFPARVVRHGNSLGINIPKGIVDVLDLEHGEALEIGITRVGIHGR